MWSLYKIYLFLGVTMTVKGVLSFANDNNEDYHDGDVHNEHKFNLHLVDLNEPGAGGLGAPMEGKIVGGTPVPIERYPHAVIFHNSGSLCAGSIINSYSVLTAAHCFQFNEDVYDMTVHVGATHKYDDNAETFDVSKVSIHKNYNKPMPFANDIAILFISTKFTFGKKVQRAIMVNSAKWMNEKQRDFTVTGWGMIRYKGPVSDMGLLMAKMRYVDRRRCGSLHSLNMTPDMFCMYGDARRDTCSGDSGGGVMWKGLLVGIVSHGDGCAGVNKPSVYSNVFHFRNWIETTIKDYYFRDLCRMRKKKSVNWF